MMNPRAYTGPGLKGRTLPDSDSEDRRLSFILLKPAFGPQLQNKLVLPAPGAPGRPRSHQSMPVWRGERMFFVSRLTRFLMGPVFVFCVLLGPLALTLAGCGSGATTALPTKAEPAPTAASELVPSASNLVATPLPDARPTAANTPSPTVDSGRVDSTTPLAEDVSRDTSSGPSVGYEELLRTIPDTLENRRDVYIDDYTLARRLFDIPLPGPGDDETALQKFYDWEPSADDPVGDTVPVWAFGGLAFFSPLNYIGRLVAANVHHLAFDIRSMDQTIVAGPPDAKLDVTLGRFDPKSTDKALRSCSECPTPDREEYGDVSYYSWGGDNEIHRGMKFGPPAFDQLGRGGRIAVLDSYVLHTWATDEMKSLIDALRDERPSLADFEEYRILVAGMSQLGAYSMFLTDNTFGLEASIEGYLKRPDATNEQAAQWRVEWEGPGTLRPYQAYGTGAGKDEVGPYTALALVHANGGPAEENVELLRRRIEEGSSSAYEIPWSDQIDVASLEIRSEGRLLLAKLRGPISKNSMAWVNSQGNFIVHD